MTRTRSDHASKIPVPYVIAYSGELDTSPIKFVRSPIGGLRLSYEHPYEGDWRYGALRARSGQSREGQPQWRKLNTRRQWDCMENLLCQVCGNPAQDPATGRVPWIVTDAVFRRVGATGGLASAPPTCLSCIPVALSLCPHLHASPAMYMVGNSRPASVLADMYTPDAEGRAYFTGEHNVELPLWGSTNLPFAFAHQLVMFISEMTPLSMTR
ncbi:hypothetical protein [Herbidospora sp. RD11066]